MEINSYHNPGVTLNRQVTSAGKIANKAFANQVSAGNLRKRTQEFEAVLIEQMLSTVQPRSGLFGSGFQGDFYQGFFLRELAARIAESPGLGLAESIYRTLKEEGGDG